MDAADAPPTSETKFESGFLSGGGAYFAHTDFKDGTRLAVHRDRNTMKFVYLDVRGGPQHGAGFSVYHAGYTAEEVKKWLRLTYPGVMPYWREYRKNHPQ